MKIHYNRLLSIEPHCWYSSVILVSDKKLYNLGFKPANIVSWSVFRIILEKKIEKF